MVDLVCRVPRLPASSDGVVVDGFSANLGGCAFNSAVAVLDAGAPCRLFAPVGQGLFANLVDERLRELGLSAFHPGGEGKRTSAQGESAPAYDSGGCVCFVEPDGQRTMITLPGIERHFCDEWFAELDSELGVWAAEDATDDASDSAGAAEDGTVAVAKGDIATEEAADAAAEGIADVAAGAEGAAVAEENPDDGAAATAPFACALASGYEVGGAGGEAIVRFFERHPEIPLLFGPGPLINELPKSLVDRLNALHPLWHLNDQEALSYTGCATVEEAGRRIAEEAGNVCVVTAGPTGSYAFFPPRDIEAAEIRVAAGAAGTCAQGSRGIDGSAKRVASGQCSDAPRAIFAPSNPVPADRLVDTVGAGDTHLGALAAAFAKGASWEETLQAANEAAARVVQVRGGALPPVPLRGKRFAVPGKSTQTAW